MAKRRPAQITPTSAKMGVRENEGNDGNIYNVKCIVAQKGRGRTLRYLVEWDVERGEQPWEKAANLSHTIALRDWKAAKLL